MSDKKNAELRSALLYFADEAIGYRHSLHFFHRWLEIGSKDELCNLIIEVGREQFEDLSPLLATINDDDNNSGFDKITEIVSLRGIYQPKHIAPISPRDLHNPTFIELGEWQLRNAHITDNCLNVLIEAHDLLNAARTDFYKVFVLLEMLFGTNTIFSCVINNDINKLGNILKEYYPNQSIHLNKLATAIANNQTLNWKDALSRNQIKSKVWLIKMLEQSGQFPKATMLTMSATSVIVGGWVGMIPFLSDMLGKNLANVINVDIDTSVHLAASQLNLGTHTNFKNSESDIREMPLSAYFNLLVIDTIVEHFKDHGEWVKTLPKGTTVVLQGNNMFDVPDHVNCHNSLEEFLNSCGLNTIIWSGELNLFKCARFMAIGKV